MTARRFISWHRTVLVTVIAGGLVELGVYLSKALTL
jgi:hypothetical protein